MIYATLRNFTWPSRYFISSTIVVVNRLDLEPFSWYDESVDAAVKLDTPAPGSTGSIAWELMYQVFKSSKPYMETVAGEFDLTPQQLYALKLLSPERAFTMGELASMLGCDASNVTSLVDRLESRGLVERRAADRDRRVKALLLTGAGQELKGRIADRMQVPPPAIRNLSAADQDALCGILSRALDSL